MKKILVTGVALLSLSAQADWSLKSEKELNDLMYLPAANTISGMTTLEFSSSEVEISTILATLSTAENDKTTLKQNLGYSFTDDLLLSVDLSQLLSSKTKYKYGAASGIPNTSASYKDSGFEDPSLNAKFRVSHQSETALNADLLLSVSPSLGKNKSSTTTKDGNAYRGGTLVKIGGEIGKKYSDKSWKVSAGADLYGKAKSEDAVNTNEISETDSRADINVGFSWQWVFNPTFTLNLNTGVGFIAESTNTNTVGDVKAVGDSTNSFLFGTDLIFNLNPKLSINLGLNGKAYAQSDIRLTTISTGASSTYIAKDYTESILSIAAKYEF